MITLEGHTWKYDVSERDACGNTTEAVLDIGTIKIPLCRDCIEELINSVDTFKNTVFCHQCKEFIMSDSGWNYGGSCKRKAREDGKEITEKDAGYSYICDCMDTCENNERMYMMTDLTNVSKYISLVLRHKPEVIGIILDEHGWANVDQLIAGVAKNNKGFDFEVLKKIVDTDEKQRYSFNDDFTLIRANQGHSIPVDVELEEIEPPKRLFHGTAVKYMHSIEKDGLISKSRLYVHLTLSKSTAFLTGKRHGEPVIYTIDSEQMHKDGYKFYLSKNGVYLTKEVPVRYIRKYMGGI